MANGSPTDNKRANGRFRITIFYKKKVMMQFENKNVNFNIDFSANIVKDGFVNGGGRSNLYIYGLAKEKRNTLEKLVQLGQYGDINVQIEYSQTYSGDNYELLCYDDLTGVFNEIGEAEFKTNLILKSGAGSVVKAYSAKAYANDVFLTEVLRTEAQSMVDGQSIKNIVLTNVNEMSYPNGLCTTGNTYNTVKNLCAETGNTMFIDKGTVHISGANFIEVSKKTIDINFSNGLLEEPHIGQINFSKKYLKSQNNISFQFKSLLLPSLNMNDVISVLGKKYTVKRIMHTIDSRHGVAYSIIEGFKNGSS